MVIAKRKTDMRAPLSIVIPTLNAGAQLPETLAALIEGLDAGLIREVVITDGGSGDATERIAADIGAIFLAGAPGRGGQLRRGRTAAGGDWLLFLHADTHLSAGWSQIVSDHIQTSDEAAYFQLKFRAEGLLPRLFAKGANARARLGLPYGDQALLISARHYDDIGGYPEIPLMEDVAMAKMLRGHILGLPVVATTSADRYSTNGWLRTGARNLWTLANYLMGSDPEKLAKRYYF